MSVTEAAEKAIRMTREAKILSYDTETSGTDWQRNFPIGYVLCSGPQDGLYVPVRHGGGGNLPDSAVAVPNGPMDPYVPHKFEIALAKAFEERSQDSSKLTVGHYLKFDCHMSANVGIMLGRNLSCTQNNEALLDEYAKSFSLDECAKRHGVTAKKGQELYDHLARIFGGPAVRNSMANYWQTSGDDPIAVDYAVGDGISTLELWHSQKKEIDEQELSTVFELENKLIWTLFRMERRGIRIDEAYLPYMQEKIRQRVAKAFEELPEGFNAGSPKDVRAYIEEVAGRTDWPTTEQGNPSFAEKWLKTFPEGQRIVALRKWSNLDARFVKPLMEKHVWNGRVHASLNQLKMDELGTAARLSCSSPNLQQIPKRDKEIAKLFRRAFIADEGMKFYEADYSQAEPRLFAHYSKEPSLIEGYSQEPFRDMHAVVAEMLKVERDPTAKRMNMGILTGMYPKSFAGHMGWSIEQATEMWNLWFDAFPRIRDFQDQAKRVLQHREYIKTLLGRRGRLEQPRFAYRAVSKIIQGGSADILKYKMLELDLEMERLGDVVHMLMTVHDSFEWQAPDTPEGDKISAWIEETMIDVQSEPLKLAVPFAVDSDSGKNWKEASFGADTPEELAEIAQLEAA